MGCNCSKRGVEIVQTVRALSKLDLEKAAQHVAEIGRTIADDADNLRQRVSAARSRMTRR